MQVGAKGGASTAAVVYAVGVSVNPKIGGERGEEVNGKEGPIVIETG